MTRTGPKRRTCRRCKGVANVKGLNRTGIEWADYVWNPVAGCRHGCEYCYARRFAKRLQGTGHPHYVSGFEPAFHPDILDAPAQLKKPSIIFAVSMGDLFGAWVPSEWIERTLDAMVPPHSYVVLTKNAGNLSGWQMEPRVWAGTSVWAGKSVSKESDACLDRILKLETWCYPRKVLSIEPMLVPVSTEYLNGDLSWLIIGGLTGPHKFAPPRAWVEPLVYWAAMHHVAVFVKDNCNLPDMPQEWPEGMRGNLDAEKGDA